METKPETQEPQTQENAAPAPAEMDVDSKINAAVTARITRETVKLQKEFDRKLAEITAQAPKAPEAAPPANLPAEYVAKLKQAEAAVARAAEIEAERAAERAEAQKKADRETVIGALSKHGVASTKHAMNYLTAEGLIYREGDKLYFKDAEHLDVSEAIKAWLKSEDGAYYLPPKGAAGSGATASKSVAVNTANMTPAQKKAEGMALLASMLGAKR